MLPSLVTQRLRWLCGQPGLQRLAGQKLLREHLGARVREQGLRHHHARPGRVLGEPLHLFSLLQVVHLAQQRGLDLGHHAVQHGIRRQRHVGVGQRAQRGAHQLHVARNGRGNAGVLHLDSHRAVAGQLCAVHLAQAGGGKRSGFKVVEQRLWLLPEGLAEHAAHQGSVERRGLVVGASQFAAHAVGQEARVHAEQL